MAEQLRIGSPARTGAPLVVALVAGAVLLAIASPAAGAILGILIAAWYTRRSVPAGVAAAAIITVLFAWVNSTKSIQGDWVWYIEHYRALAYTPLAEYLGVGYLGVASEPTEPLYYAFAQVISVTTGASTPALAVAVTVVIYGAIGGACVFAAKAAAAPPWATIVGTTFGMVAGITFTLSTQLVRQEIASAFIAAAVIAAGYRRWLLVGAFVVAAALTHNSALIPAAGLALAIFLRGRERGRWFRVVLSAGIFYGLGRFYLATGGDNAYTGQNNGSISPLVIAFDVAVLIGFLVTMRKRRLSSNPIAAIILLCVPAFYGFVLGVASQPLPLLRMYFFVEVLRALMLVFICVAVLRSRARLIYGVALIAGAFCYLGLRLAQSPFVYGTTLVDIIRWSPLSS